jgi:transposase
VAIKSPAQQDDLALHRARSLLLKQALECSKHLRAMLHERGLICAKGAAPLRRLLQPGAESEQLSGQFKSTIALLTQRWQESQKLVEKFDHQIKKKCYSDERAQRRLAMAGVGPLTANAIVATIGNAREFRSGRELSAFLGPVPRQHSSGGKIRMRGISKHGDRYLRTLLIHGARSALRTCGRRDDPRRRWTRRLLARRGPNLAAVAVANQHACSIWALLTRGQPYTAVAMSD